MRNCERAAELSDIYGVPVTIETLNGRPTYSVDNTCRYLEAVPRLRLTADFSCWMVVHESNLADQGEALQLAIERGDYIHARVGYSEGPSVTDHRAPEWKPEVENHLSIWQQIVDERVERGSEMLLITPEFGLPNYMHTLPHTNLPVADVWGANVFMRDLLKEGLRT